ncbi:MAG: glycoside hydrolase family 3 N-terminal domain-containing protein, partial [Nocardioidaceae bacterium]
MNDSIAHLAHAVLMPGFVGPKAPGWLLDAVGNGLGGVCYFGHNVESPDQLRMLSEAIHAAGPALVAIDEEGGSVTRLYARDGSPHVGPAVLGRADDPGLTAAVARLIGREVRAAGVDVDLAPVVDVNTNPSNPVIGVRSFGADPGRVARHADAFVAGLQAAGVAATAKHFPGHGDTAVDSHLGMPVIEANLGQLRARDLLPFAAAVAAGARCVMTAHIVFRALDDRPATVSPAVISLLRDELGFDGLVVSDAMDMRAVVDTIGYAEGVVQALVAGVDLVALGNPQNSTPGHESAARRSDRAEFTEARDAVIAAVDRGRLPLERLAEAAGRVR